MSHRQYTVKDNTIQDLQVRLLTISHSRDEKDWQSVFHTHHFTELFYVSSGEGRFLFRDRTYVIKTGDLVIVPPYVEHTEQSLPSLALEYYVAGIDGIAFLPEQQKEEKHARIFCNFHDRMLAGSLFEQMLYEARRQDHVSDQICQNLLKVLILRMIRSQKLVPVPIQTVRMTKECARIKEYLDANYAENITLDSLTSLTHMNKYYMAHSFSKYTGQSPIQYLNQRRLEAACALLENTDYSVSAVATATGFSSQSYFTQIFRKKFGITPVKYRKKHTAV